MQNDALMHREGLKGYVSNIYNEKGGLQFIVWYWVSRSSFTPWSRPWLAYTMCSPTQNTGTLLSSRLWKLTVHIDIITPEWSKAHQDIVHCTITQNRDSEWLFSRGVTMFREEKCTYPPKVDWTPVDRVTDVSVANESATLSKILKQSPHLATEASSALQCKYLKLTI